MSIKSVKILTYANTVCINLCAEPPTCCASLCRPYWISPQQIREVRLKQSISTLASSRNMYACFFTSWQVWNCENNHRTKRILNWVALCTDSVTFVWVFKEPRLLKWWEQWGEDAFILGRMRVNSPKLMWIWTGETRYW